MAIKVGCFALIDPFSGLEHQLERIRDWGFKYADVTDSTDGGSVGVEYGFAAAASLDGNPFDIQRMFEKYGLTITTYCAHANLLDPSAPWHFGTMQIIKAVRAAAAIGVKHIITSEGDPMTEFGHNLTDKEALFLIRERLYEPLRMAEDFGVKILLEPHGKYTDSIDYMEKILELCDSPALGVNFDSGNSWLGGTDPVAMVLRLHDKIEHVHWKDWSADMEANRGKIFGAGMSGTALGAGVVDIKGVYQALVDCGYDGYSTLEIAGDDAVMQSYRYLQSLGAE